MGFQSVGHVKEKTSITCGLCVLSKQNIDASEGSEKDRVTVTQKDWETWREDFLRDLTGKETMVPADFDEVYAQLVTELDDVEREVLQLRYQEGLSLREIAEHKAFIFPKLPSVRSLLKSMRKFLSSAIPLAVMSWSEIQPGIGRTTFRAGGI